MVVQSTLRVSNHFQFSKVAVRELQGILGDRASTVVPRLTMIVGRHRATKSLESLGGRDEITRLIAALRKVVRRIDDTSETTRLRLRGSLVIADLLQNSNAWESVTAVQECATQCLRRLETAIRRRAGRPRETARGPLLRDVALLLAISGIKVTTGRDGLFARVLAVVLSELDGHCPEDMFPFIKDSSDFVKKASRGPKGLQQFVKEAFRYADDALWKQV